MIQTVGGDRSTQCGLYNRLQKLNGKPVVRVKNILGDDVYGRWHIEKIVVQKNGQRYAIVPDKKAFSTKEEAEYYAHTRTQRLVERELQNEKRAARWRALLKFLCTAAFLSVMSAVAVPWFRKLAPSVETTN